MSEKPLDIETLSPRQQQARLAELLRRKAGGVKSYPLSFPQQRLWFLEQLQPGGHAYNITEAVRLSGALDDDALAESLREVARRHEVLRTSILTVKGRPLQIVSSSPGLNLSTLDLSVLPDPEAEARRLAAEEASRPFDLSRGPLWRAIIMRLGGREHVVIFTMHHIISDGWSMEILIREVAALYHSLAEGSPASLPELPIQYGDFAHWQQGHFQRGALDAELAYWERQLAGAPAEPGLKTDRPRPPVQTFRGATESLLMPPSLAKSLHALSQRHRATLFMTLLAAFKAVLYRYTRQEDVLVGTPISNRRKAEVEGLIGFFANTLVLRTRLTGDLTFRELLETVRAISLDAYAHQDVPFEKLVERLQPERDLSRTPLFQVMFVLGYPRAQRVDLPGLQLAPLDFDRGTAKFDLSLFMRETGQGLSATLEYNADLFDAATAARMLGHLHTLLAAAAEDPDRKLSELPLLTEAECRRVLVEWNETRVEHPTGVCVHRLFERQAAQTPQAAAVAGGDVRLTYGELNGRANRIARHLKSLGVGPDTPVGVFLGRSPETVAALLGVMKAGGAYLPLDAQYPDDRLAFMIKDARVPLVLTTGPLAARLSGCGAPLVLLDDDGESVSARDDGDLGLELSENNLAYVIYTSGSTGRPKGVGVSHAGLVNLVHWHRRTYGVTASDRATQLASVAFDASVWELWPYLTAGASVHLPDEETILSPPRLLRFFADEAITISFLPTPLAEAVLGETLPEDLSLRALLAGGDRLRRGSWRTLPFALFNHYGPTENAVVATCAPVAPDAAEAVPPPIGRPIDNVQVYILDPNLRPVGAAGELYVGGAGLARGYVGSPALTAERFIPNPFSTEPGARLYRTGDVARHLAGGDIEFLGRADYQVKIRGFRVELGEIEAALGEHPGLRESAVVLREDASGEKRLVAYVVAAGGPVTGDELRTYLGGRLPGYMIPSAFVTLKALPVNANGKTDRAALPAPDWAGPRADGEFVGPRNPLEEVLTKIWGDLLRVECVGVHDNFFELGGHSLLATQAVSRVREIFKVELRVRDFFESPTIAGLAEKIEAARWSGRTASPPLVPVARDGLVPLSFAQQRLWFLDQMEPNSNVNNVPLAVRLTGRLDVGTLEACLTEIVRRHEVLRTTFVMVGDEPAQVFAPELSLSLAAVDLSHLGEAEREARARRLAVEEVEKPFDLATGPLMRAALVRLAGQEHLFVLTMHHIVSDGWSMGVLVREVAELYRALGEGRPPALPELPVQYADYAVWQREWLRGEALEAQLSYWREQLAGAPALLELPTDRPRPPVQTYRGTHLPIAMPPELLDGLKALARREGASLFMLLLAAFKVLLYRYSGERDVVVGSDIANRNRGETEGLLGFFINQLVLRTDLSGDPTFRALLGRVRETALDAYAHQDVPFEKLVEALQPERHLSRSPLFQIKFTLQNMPVETLELPELSLKMLDVRGHTSRYDIGIGIGEGEGGLYGLVEYSTELFDRTTVERMFRHYQTLLESVVADPSGRIDTLDLLSEAERRQLLVEWNDTRGDYPREACFHHLFEQQVARTPDAVAVEGGRERLTYSELNRRANRLAHHLHGLGVRRGTLVGLCVERSPEMIVGLLGILKAGGAYLPLDPTYPLERVSYMLEDAQAPVLVTQSGLVDALPPFWGQTVCLDEEWAEAGPESVENLKGGAEPDDLAYVIYTSGSTGRSKGVMVEHRGLCNMVAAQAEVFRPGEGMRVLQFASLSFDISFFEISLALASGATLCVGTKDSLLPGPALTRYMNEHEVTAAALMPSVLAALTPAELPHLRTLLCGGESGATQLAERWAAGRDFFHGYGPTEATIWVTSVGYDEEGGADSIGRPIANTQFYILDETMAPVPQGVPGEMYIGGVCLARGYLNRPGLTAELFVPNPFYDEPRPGTGTRLYRTGDMARYLSGGRMEFLGRADHQVKVRGFRIELGEVEAAVSAHQSVRENVVLVREDAPGDKRLLAYVVARDGDSLTTGELRGFLRERLPEHMIPSAFVLLPSLPQTPTGKVDRRALLGLETEAPDPGTYVPARNLVEEMLVGVWLQVLGAERVGAEDNFFELGGHSLLATQLISQVRAAFGVELPLRAVFESPTLAALAVKVESLRREASGLARSPITPVGRDRELPLSFAQQRLWFLYNLEPEGCAYLIPVAYRLRGPLDVTALGLSINEVVRRHEVLRASFPTADGRPAQVIAQELTLSMPVTELGHLSGSEQEAMVGRLLAEESGRPIDLSNAPLFRLKLLRLAEQEHVLLLTMHHIVSDGWSMGVLVREVAELYRALGEGRPPALPELPVQYADYAVWQREWLRGEALEAQLSYWREQLAGAPALLELPTDRPRPPVQTYRGTAVHVSLSEGLSESLRSLSRAESATLYMTLLAVFEVLLHRYSGQETVVVGSPVAGRNRAETEGLIGFFVNTLALRADLSPGLRFTELLARVREGALEAYTRQDLPFDRLVDALQIERDLSRTPLYQVVFMFDNIRVPALDIDGLTVTPVDSGTHVAKFDLALSMADGEQGLSGWLEYNSDLFDAATAERMVGHFTRLLEGVAADPHEQVARLPLLGAEEEQQLLYGWNETAADFPEDLCVHELFERRAARTPDGTALIYEGGRLTFGELNRRANQLAHHLRSLGVGPDAAVGVYMERSPEMVVGLLAVLKAGGAYLPLETEYPPERLAYMIADAGARVLLTQGRLAERLLRPSGCHIVRVDDDWASVAGQSDLDPATVVTPENSIYTIYTSGSTGEPKGVTVPHRGVCNCLWWMQQTHRLDEGDRVLLKSPLSFDSSVWELFWPLFVGASVVVARPEGHRDSAYLAEVIARHKVTTVHFVPSMFQLFLEEEGLEDCDSLRRVICGGEALPVGSVEKFFERLGGELHNYYGPTETSIGSINWKCVREGVRQTVPIGRPISNTQIYLLDSGLHPVPVGVPGELYTGGEGLARGYVNKPGLTAEKFIPDPFSARPGARLYRTGDRALYLPDGNIEFLGRADHQVKLRGYRIELSEVEAALESHPAIRESLATVREDVPGDKRLTAYLITLPAASFTTGELRAFLKGRLPDYMIPSAFVTLKEWPLMTSGKIDRKALPPPDGARPELGGEYLAPRDEAERVLAGIWAEVLRVERVGVRDNFFELGGDSILSIQIVTRAAQAGLRLTTKQLFQHQTVAELAAAAGRGEAAAAAEQGLVT
ncbi:MAG: amino acid adenylation domain-containing protein, partial [Pyrinomonadaceae bacterium]